MEASYSLREVRDEASYSPDEVRGRHLVPLT
eukprot:gene7561-biopygen3905